MHLWHTIILKAVSQHRVGSVHLRVSGSGVTVIHSANLMTGGCLVQYSRWTLPVENVKLIKSSMLCFSYSQSSKSLLSFIHSSSQSHIYKTQ